MAAAPVTPLEGSRAIRSPLTITEASITGGFWADWQRANREITIPHAVGWLERDGTVDNLRRVGGSLEPGAHRGYWFSDSDLYKTLEGVAWELGRAPSPELEKLVDDYAAVIARAQEDDGYLNSFVQAGLDVRWDNLVKSHELYCIGHLVQAAVAHRRTTGSDSLFRLAVAAADCAVRDFGEGRRVDTDGHEEIEMALVELYRETGTRAYLDLAVQLLDERGRSRHGGDGHFEAAYFQDAVPVRDQREAVGHAVRAVYLLCGMVDVHLETGEQALLDAAVAQWEDMTYRKTYLNGALGSRFIGEAFGDPYELPPDLVYGETCATIGNIMLSWRLLLATGQSRFADVIERSLHNLFAASTSVGRDAFFYNNPAQRRTALDAAPTDSRPDRADAPGTRPVWFDCACCPPNIVRTVASLQAYLATTDAGGVQLHQYMPSEFRVRRDAGDIGLEVATGYPLEGRIEVTVRATPSDPWALSLRVPEWASGVELTVAGAPVDATPTTDGYAVVERAWSAGDVVVLEMLMAPRLTRAHPAADALRGTVAIERGPLVYCLESPDQPDVDLDRVELVTGEPLDEQPAELLGQRTVTIGGTGFLRDDDAWASTGWMPLGADPAASGRRVPLVAIPYHLWANRGPSTMRIFVPVHADPPR